MQLPGFIGFISVLILACNSDDKVWKINVTRNIIAQSGSNVTVHCNFSYPLEHHIKDVQVYWKTSAAPDRTNCSNGDVDKGAFVFHPNQTCVLDKYKQKTRLIGDKGQGSCTLQIANIQSSDQRLFVRIFVKNEKYSYRKDFVTISVNGFTQDTQTGVIQDNQTVPTYYTTPDFSITNENDPKSTDDATILHVVIPVAVAIVIIALVAGIISFQKHKRSRIVTREDSGYYANFSRALSNPPKREAPLNTYDKKLPERKVIDDPVYINVKAPPGHMDQNMDGVDNIYANMDYTN